MEDGSGFGKGKNNVEPFFLSCYLVLSREMNEGCFEDMISSLDSLLEKAKFNVCILGVWNL